MTCKNCCLMVVLLTLVFTTGVPEAAIGQGLWNKAKPLIAPHASDTETSASQPQNAAADKGLLRGAITSPMRRIQSVSEAALNQLLGREEIALAMPEDIAAQAPVLVAHSGSLFVGKAYFSVPDPDMAEFERNAPEISAPQAQSFAPHGVARLKDVIAKAEAGRAGYDAVQLAAKIKPPKPPTEMRLSEIYAWIDATPGQHHAIGRYQFIPKTLRRLVTHLGVSPSEHFTPEIQDRLADQLLREAGLLKFRAGDITQAQFMHNLSKIWAGLPSASGKSFYHGYAGNKATMSWKEFDRLVGLAFADGTPPLPVARKNGSLRPQGIALQKPKMPTRANF